MLTVLAFYHLEPRNVETPMRAAAFWSQTIGKAKVFERKWWMAQRLLIRRWKALRRGHSSLEALVLALNPIIPGSFKKASYKTLKLPHQIQIPRRLKENYKWRAGPGSYPFPKLAFYYPGLPNC